MREQESMRRESGDRLESTVESVVDFITRNQHRLPGPDIVGADIRRVAQILARNNQLFVDYPGLLAFAVLSVLSKLRNNDIDFENNRLSKRVSVALDRIEADQVEFNMQLDDVIESLKTRAEKRGGEKKGEGKRVHVKKVTVTAGGEESDEMGGVPGDELDELTVALTLKEAEKETEAVFNFLTFFYGQGSTERLFDRSNPGVMKLLQRANKLFAFARELDISFQGRGVKPEGSNFRGVTTGNNIRTTLRSQYILPDEVFMERYANRSLLQRKQEKEGQGDFFFIIDRSGSMGTRLNQFTNLENAIAVVLASAMRAKRSNKRVEVMFFSGEPTGIMDVTSNPLQLLDVYAGGGTDLMKAFEEVEMQREKLRGVRDIFVISDFETPWYESVVVRFKQFLRSNGMKLRCLHVSPFEDKRIKEYCDEYYILNSFDAGQLFQKISSSIH